MLYLAQWEDGLTDHVVAGASPDDALARLREVAEIEDPPDVLTEIPDDVVVLEVRWAEDGITPNPADVAEGGVVLDPLEPMGEWLEGRASTLESIATPTEDEDEDEDGGEEDEDEDEDDDDNTPAADADEDA